MDKNYLIDALGIIDGIAEKYSISFDVDNKYYSILKNTKRYLDANSVVLPVDERKYYEDYILSLHIPNIQTNIDNYFGGDILGDHYTIKDLSDNQLLDYLVDIFRTITFTQKDNLLLAKYGIVIWNTGFHDLAKACRGIVIDTDTMQVVSHPFDKFFNINEVPETSEKIVKKHINKAEYIYATDKKDGSTISVSLYKGKPLITTNGSFENDQIKWAADLFKRQYPNFLPNLKSGYTYIFELIHPENKIVINYGDEKALYLLAVRNLETNKLMSLDEVHTIGDKYNIPYPDVYDFTDLDIMIKLAHELKGANKEGWVIRIGTADSEMMCKLKLDEYFAMHKAFGKTTPMWVYKHLINGDLDDYLAICNEFQKASVQDALDKIEKVKRMVRENAIDLAKQYLLKYNIEYADFLKDRDRMITMIQDIFGSKSPFKNYAVDYLKNADVLDTRIEKIQIKHFKKFLEMFEEKENEKSANCHLTDTQDR